ncbi:MAG: D-alanine--poly(phosphoribitol) ligase, partial [Lachnospiraceae bacterium]|nr:D-alanine--poly(phosphoribitol) ligase [Lachnospiraceae bacterium]
TGDLGCYGKTGELYFQGRKDFQIKHMGHRIELEEIEEVLGRMPGVERCCCVFDTGRQRIIGYYTGDGEEKNIHKAIREYLPGYMVPRQIVKMQEIPLNKNGKTDRKYFHQKLEEQKP